MADINPFWDPVCAARRRLRILYQQFPDNLGQLRLCGEGEPEDDGQ